MKNKTRLLRVMFWAPVILGLARLLLTFAVFIWNPLSLPLRWIQLVHVVVLVVSIFTYLKLYTDSDPIVSLILPTIVHFLLIFAFRRIIVIVPFLPLVILDIIFLLVKGFKATLFPFEIEGEEDDDSELGELEDE